MSPAAALKVEFSQLKIRMDKAVEDFLGCFLPAIDSQMDVSAALNGSEYHRLVSKVSTSDMTALPANVRLVHFHGSLEHFRTDFLDSLADTMAEIPRCLITYFQRPLELIGAHALLACVGAQTRRRLGDQGLVRDVRLWLAARSPHLRCHRVPDGDGQQERD